jgi:cell division protein FtsW (lipid II flippase)
MENSQDQIIVPQTCENCQANHENQQKFCSQCSFPIGGNEDEKRSFRLTVSSRKRLFSDAQDKIKSAKTIIYVLAALFVVFGLIAGFAQDDFSTMVVNIVLSLVFLILAAWSKKNPFGAILTAFIIYITLHVTNAFIDPATIPQGIILKIFFIAAFVKGIRSAQEAQGYLNELEKFKAAPVF